MTDISHGRGCCGGMNSDGCSQFGPKKSDAGLVSEIVRFSTVLEAIGNCREKKIQAVLETYIFCSRGDCPVRGLGAATSPKPSCMFMCTLKEHEL